MVLHAMIPFFMDYFSLMEFVLFLFYCFRQLWWPISVPALSNGFFQFLRSHWYSQPSSTQPKSRWVGWLNLQSKVLNKHSGQMEESAAHTLESWPGAVFRRKMGRRGYNREILCFPAQNGHSDYADSFPPTNIIPPWLSWKTWEKIIFKICFFKKCFIYVT